jgi:hypothetical protein
LRQTSGSPLVGITNHCTGRTGDPPQFCFKMGQYAGEFKAVSLLRENWL